MSNSNERNVLPCARGIAGEMIARLDVVGRRKVAWIGLKWSGSGEEWSEVDEGQQAFKCKCKAQ
jgi:hypothetical protein